MRQNTNKIILWGAVSVAVLGLVVLVAYRDTTPGKLDGFAQCLKDEGAVFYGAFWCPHCQKQKTMFGKSQKLLPYVECSTPDGKGQLSECIEKKIESYPTWVFADATRLSGEIPLETLAEKTSCTLPE